VLAIGKRIDSLAFLFFLLIFLIDSSRLALIQTNKGLDQYYYNSYQSYIINRLITIWALWISYYYFTTWNNIGSYFERSL